MGKSPNFNKTFLSVLYLFNNYFPEKILQVSENVVVVKSEGENISILPLNLLFQRSKNTSIQLGSCQTTSGFWFLISRMPQEEILWIFRNIQELTRIFLFFVSLSRQVALHWWLMLWLIQLWLMLWLIQFLSPGRTKPLGKV